MGLGPGFWAAEHLPPLVPASHFYTMCEYGNTYAGKSFCWHTGGGGGVILKIFSDFYIF